MGIPRDMASEASVPGAGMKIDSLPRMAVMDRCSPKAPGMANEFIEHLIRNWFCFA